MISKNIDTNRRKRALIHETTHKISKNLNALSAPLNPYEVLDDFNKNREEMGDKKINDPYLQELRNDYAHQIKELKHIPEDKIIADELVSMRSTYNPSKTFKTPETWYDKELNENFNSFATQRRLFEPSLVEVELPHTGDLEIFEKKRKYKIPDLYEMQHTKSIFDPDSEIV